MPSLVRPHTSLIVCLGRAVWAGNIFSELRGISLYLSFHVHVEKSKAILIFDPLCVTFSLGNL